MNAEKKSILTPDRSSSLATPVHGVLNDAEHINIQQYLRDTVVPKQTLLEILHAIWIKFDVVRAKEKYPTLRFFSAGLDYS